MADGPLGGAQLDRSVQADHAQPGQVQTTAFPSGIALAATWDVGVADAAAHAVGRRPRRFGRDMILGDCEHQPGAAVGAQFPGFWRGPVFGRADGCVLGEEVQAEGVIRP